jgi:hypothetical protein
MYSKENLNGACPLLLLPLPSYVEVREPSQASHLRRLLYLDWRSLTLELPTKAYG